MQQRFGLDVRELLDRADAKLRQHPRHAAELGRQMTKWSIKRVRLRDRDEEIDAVRWADIDVDPRVVGVVAASRRAILDTPMMLADWQGCCSDAAFDHHFLIKNN